MFFNKRVDIKMANQISFSSKATLKKEALILSKGNVQEAEKIYDFLIKDMGDIPDVEPKKLSTIEQVKMYASDGFNFIDEHQDTIIGIVSRISSVLGKKTTAPPSPNTTLPQINL